MCDRRAALVWSLLLALGCGGGGPAPNNVNPYANNQAPVNNSPPPVMATPRGSSPASPRRPATTHTAAPKQSAPQTIDVPEAGAAAEMAVPLTFVEYAKFARQSAEMLAEMTKIHAAVAESGNATAYQERWGKLTAEHTALVRRVVDSAYPPADVALQLMPNAGRRLHGELASAKAVMEEYDDLEGGLAQPYAQAQKIFEHLTKNLTAAEVESALSGNAGPGNK